MSNIVIRNINGVRGFCIYKNNVPYTYIYTKHAIEMLGLIKIQNGYKRLRINRFGEHFASVIEGELPEGITQSECGINISNLYYTISQDYSDLCPTCGTQKMTRRPVSKYDQIIPEFTLDRIIFAIGNRLHNKTAEEFRLQLIWNIIPHFQQTATQDQINKVPILNQTTGFIYDNKSYSIFSNSSYNFYKHILNIQVERIRVLLESDDFTKTYVALMQNFSDIIKLEAGKDIFDNVRNARDVLYNNTGIYKSTSNLCLDDYIDTIICDSLLYNYFIMYLNTQIRQLEHEIMDNMNSQQQESDFTDRALKQVVEFIPVDKRTHSYKINPGDYMFDYRLMIKASNY